MSTDYLKTGVFPDPNPWHPMTEAIDVKHLGKLAEECNELGAACARCIIQGIDEAEPTTKKPNRQWLTEEVADVVANLFLVIEHFDLDTEVLDDRTDRKTKMLRKWHAMA